MRYDRESLKNAGRAVYHDRALRLFWGFFLFVAVLCWLSR